MNERKTFPDGILAAIELLEVRRDLLGSMAQSRDIFPNADELATLADKYAFAAEGLRAWFDSGAKPEYFG